MRLLEKILVVLVIIGGLFKLALFPGSAAILGLSITTLSILYFSFSFLLFNGIKLRNVFKKSSYQNVSRNRIIGAIGTGFPLSIVLMGFLFDLLILPGGLAMLYVGLTWLGLVFVVIITRVLKSGVNPYYRGILTRLIPIASFCLLMYLTPVEKQIDFFYRNHPEYAQAYKEYLQDPDNEELFKKVEEERNKMFD